MSAFRDAVTRLANQTEREIARLYERLAAGSIDRDTFTVLAAQVIARARAKGVSLADLALAAEAVRQIGEEFGPLGLTPPDSDLERLQGSVGSVLDERPDYIDDNDRERLRESQRARLTRLARDSSAESATWAMRLAMLERGVRGWVRETDANPCPVCTNLADGVVRSPRVVMIRHGGCCCCQRAVFN